jgi:nicotinate phosphoribosyltransferase
MSIITSLLDQDYYKFFMSQAIYHNFTNVNAVWKYKLRSDNNVIFDNTFMNKFEKEMSDLCTLRFKQNELDYLKKTTFFKDDYIDFLSLFKLQEKHIKIDMSNGFGLEFKGSNLMVKMFEIFTMEIISELHFQKYQRPDIYVEGNKRLQTKINIIKQHNINNGNNSLLKFSDFGGRRRFSKSWHEHVLETLIKEIPHNLVGTSNVYFSKKFNITPIGTQAHSWFQMIQAIVRLCDFQKTALQAWCDEYRGRLGIALTDTICMDAFLNDFDLYFAKLFDGCRHDSGSPEIWCNKLIQHYEKLGINPQTKTAVFSDGLTIEKAIKLFDMFKYQIKIAFGIGTHLTNDLGVTPLNHVIKLIKVNDKDIAKISDSPGKTMCTNESYITYLKEVFGIK